MNYNLTELEFPSSDGIHTIYAEVYVPRRATARGVVQLVHGMIDHTGRYKALAEYLTERGFILAGHHHLGHGKSVSNPEDYGFFADEGGVDAVVKDMHLFNRYLRNSFPALPVIVLGHSMGSFITREYAVRYPHSLRGAVILGTSGPNPLVGTGIFLSKLLGKLYGNRHRSELVRKMAFGSYNKKFPKSDGKDAWLTSEVSLVADRAHDPYTGFTFTVSGYKDLFTLIKNTNSREWFASYPKEMPTLIVSGDMDPVGNYGKGPRTVYSKLMIEGCSHLSLKLYEGARHELFNEKCREEFFGELTEWIEGVIK